MLVGKVNRNPDNKKEERKDKIGGGASIPRCVPEWRINVFPCSGIVHQDHGRYGDAAENIQRFETLANFHDSIYKKTPKTFIHCHINELEQNSDHIIYNTTIILIFENNIQT
jgi:hypothetical protein